MSRFLKEVDLPIVENKLCVEAFKNEVHTVNETNMVCAGYSDATKDACQGRSIIIFTSITHYVTSMCMLSLSR